MIKMKINFFNHFDGEINIALNPSVYGIRISKKGSNKTSLLYVGESDNPIIRCGTHLNKFCYVPNYLGVTKDILNNDQLELSFTIIENNTSKNLKEREITLIRELSPAVQSGISDRIYPEDSIRVEKVNELIKSL